MSLLLASDAVTLFPPGDRDPHGWALEGTSPSWEGTGNLQLAAGTSDPRAADRGGHGPYAPAASADGALYLPPGAPAVDGDVAEVRGRRYTLSQVRLVDDPVTPGSGIACLIATVTAWDTDKADADA